MENKQHNYNLLEHFLFLPTWLNESKLKQQLNNKTILITGASYGIGEQLAYLLAKQGAHLLLVARTQEKLIGVKNKVKKEGGSAIVHVCDLSKEEEVKRFLLSIADQTIDIVVNNAGRSIMRSIYQSLDRFHDFERTMAINYFGPVQLLLGLIPMLEKTKGHIINVSAVNVLLAPAPYWAAYQASKTAFDQWFRCIAPELKARAIKCSSIYLPLVKTRMIAPTKAYEKAPAMSAEHVAKIIAKTSYTQRKKFAPWWLIFGQLGSIVFRRPWEWLSAYFANRKQAQKSNKTKKELVVAETIDQKQHLLDLIETASSKNIKLAFMLMDSSNIHLDFSAHLELFNWFEREQPSMTTNYHKSYDSQLSTLQNKLKFLFSIWELTLYTDNSSQSNTIPIPSQISLLKNLTLINIQGYQIELIPSYIFQFSALRKLILIDNLISHIPKEIKNLTKLEELYLNDNRLKTLPSYIFTLQSLKKLDLSQNKIIHLPNEISQLQHLEELDLSFNAIPTLPLCVLDMPMLKTLKINDNLISRQEINVIKAKRPNFEIIFD